MTETADAKPAKPGLKAMVAALRQRKPASMFAFGFASGLPFAAVIGTLNAWLGEAKVDLATIGVLSWAGLAYAFKFLWSPAVDKLPPPLPLGRRRGWIATCQIVIAAALALIASIDPSRSLGLFAAAAVLAAFASATQDIVIDAWRIDVADETASLDLLSALYQFGYRLAALAGGAGALVLAGRSSWPLAYWIMAGLMAVLIVATLRAPEPDARLHKDTSALLRTPGALGPKWRDLALAAVLLAWGWAIWTIGAFMVSILAADPNAADKPSASAFMAQRGPLIVLATVIFPAMVAAACEWARLRGRGVIAAQAPIPAKLQAIGDHLYAAIVAPLSEIMGRLKFAAVLVLVLILSYRLTDSVWGPFAFPFYLGELKYTKDEVAFASKIFGVMMTIAGITLAGISLLKLGRMLTLSLGAALAALSNLLYADLALGGRAIDAALHATGLSALLGAMGSDDRMGRLLVAISGENIAGGFAGAAFVAYLSSIAARAYSAVQYALLSSLTLLIGSLGRGPLGEAIDQHGYAPVFYFTAALGAIGFAACLLEWMRQGWAARAAAAPAQLEST